MALWIHEIRGQPQSLGRLYFIELLRNSHSFTKKKTKPNQIIIVWGFYSSKSETPVLSSSEPYTPSPVRHLLSEAGLVSQLPGHPGGCCALLSQMPFLAQSRAWPPCWVRLAGSLLRLRAPNGSTEVWRLLAQSAETSSTFDNYQEMCRGACISVLTV